MHAHSQKTHVTIDREKVLALVAPIAEAHGGEVVDVELKTEQGGWVLRVYVEKVGAAANRLSTKDAAVDLELCAKVARELSPALDVADLIPHRYHLEVSSPGVERPLRRREDFARFSGEKAKLWLHKPCAGQKVLVGTLASFENDVVSVQDGHRTFQVPFEDVERARLVFEFGPASKPGTKPGKPGKQAKQPKPGKHKKQSQ
jgi:ribosome maturation factor RimP